MADRTHLAVCTSDRWGTGGLQTRRKAVPLTPRCASSLASSPWGIGFTNPDVVVGRSGNVYVTDSKADVSLTGSGIAPAALEHPHRGQERGLDQQSDGGANRNPAGKDPQSPAKDLQASPAGL